MTTRDELKARLFLRAVLPLVRILHEERRQKKRLTQKINAIVQFMVKGTDTGSHLVYTNGDLQVVQGIHAKPNVAFIFKDVKSLNDFFTGKLTFPQIKGKLRFDLIARTLPLLFGLKLLMPNVDPKDPAKRALKVKLLLYMLTTALSQLNKAGEPTMAQLVKNSPDRIYQWIVEGGPSAYLRMKSGKTKAGRGVYSRRHPFVLMKFSSVEGAYQVLTNKVALVEAVKRRYMVVEGAMEYSKEIGIRMQAIEELITT